MVKYYKIKEEIDIISYKGKEKLTAEYMAGLIKVTGFSKVRVLGITRDADNSPSDAFKSIKNAIEKAGLVPPKEPFKFSGHSPKIGVFIFPGKNFKGMLEDVCLNAVKDDPAMPCIEALFKCLEDKKIKSPKNMSKAKAQAFLATREETGYSIGVAAKEGYWLINNDAFKDAFKEIGKFLKQLCS